MYRCRHLVVCSVVVLVVVVVVVKSHSTSFAVFHLKYYSLTSLKPSRLSSIVCVCVCLVSVSSSVGKGQLDCWPPAKNSRDSKVKKAAAFQLEGLKDKEKTEVDLLVSRP